MVFASVDSPLYKVVWTYDGGSIDITKYIITQNSEEGLTIQNNKIQLNIKLIKDFLFVNEPVPFYTNPATGKQQFSKSSFLDIYLKLDDGTGDIDTDSNLDKFKTYFVTDYSISEPSNIISLSAVDLQYKITNTNTSDIFRERFNGTSTTIATDVLTDTGNSFPVPGPENSYNDGLKLQTLELSQGGNKNTYLILDNTATTVTVHKTITETTGATYKIGDSSPFALFKTIQKKGRDASGRGEDFIQVTANATLDIGADYSNGIQFLRPDNSAFPIINLGSPFEPVYKMIDTLSGFGACNLPLELESIDLMVIKRDMIFAVVFNSNTFLVEINWFYLNAPEKSVGTRSITAVSSNVVTVSSPDANDLNGIARISVGNGVESFRILDIDGNDYTLDLDAETLGVTSSTDFFVFKGTDYIWDNTKDYESIFSYKLGGKDEENYNHVLFVAGKNPVGNTSVKGHYFNEQTKSATLKETFIPLHFIADNMINYEIQQGNLRKVNDVWEGNEGASGFTSDPSLWDWTTTFGFDTDYVITSRTTFNSSFKKAARRKGIFIARNLAMAQKENLLKGTFKIRGQKFVKIGVNNDLISTWYQKGTRILFKKSDVGLLNDGKGYFIFVVSKIKQQIDKGSWETTLNVEYSNFTSNEIVK